MWRVDVTYYQTCGGLMCRDHLRSGFYSKYHPVPVNRIASFLEGVGQSQQIIDPTRQCDIFVRQCYIVVAHSRHRLVLTFLQTTTRETSHKIPRTAIQAEHTQKKEIVAFFAARVLFRLLVFPLVLALGSSNAASAFRFSFPAEPLLIRRVLINADSKPQSKCSLC